VGTRKIKLFMDSWWQHCIHCLAGGHAPHFCTLELVEDGIWPCHYIKFPERQKVKPAQILHRLNELHKVETLSQASAFDWYNKFSKGHKEVQNIAVSRQFHGKCVFGFRRNASSYFFPTCYNN
jgi:hypothetical protein